MACGRISGSGSTPCSDWDARTLLNHVVFGNRTFTSIVNGKPPPPQEQIRTMRDQDQLGDDPVVAWRDSAAGLLAAFDAPGVLGRTFSSPLGEMPGAGLARLRITETLVHGWDLARSTGQPVPFDEPLARRRVGFHPAAAAGRGRAVDRSLSPRSRRRRTMPRPSTGWPRTWVETSAPADVRSRRGVASLTPVSHPALPTPQPRRL